MASSTNVSWWQFSRWVTNVARNSHITPPDGPSIAFIRLFLKVMCDPMTGTGTRPWLRDKFFRKAVGAAHNYQCDIDTEPVQVLVGMLEVVGRDFKKIPITDYEAFGCISLFMFTGHRLLGTGPYFGSTSGSNVGVP